jgi:hypothetical protein
MYNLNGTSDKEWYHVVIMTCFYARAQAYHTVHPISAWLPNTVYLAMKYLFRMLMGHPSKERLLWKGIE